MGVRHLMSKLIAFLVLGLVASSALAGECSDVYMRGGEPSKFDPLAHKALDAHYDVVDVDPAKRAFESPKATAGTMPSTPTDNKGSPIHGYVLIAFVVTASGRAESPTIVESTDTQLSQLAIAATNSWRFKPGEVDAKAECVAAMQEFKF